MAESKPAANSSSTPASGSGGSSTNSSSTSGNGSQAAPKKGGVKQAAKDAAAATPQGRAASTASTATKKKPSAKGVRITGGRKWLLAEFVFCVLLLGLAALTGKVSGKDDPQLTGSHLAIRGSAVAGVFMILGLAASGGKGAEKAAGAIGAVITLAYVFNEGPTFKVIGAWARKQSDAMSGKDDKK